MQESPDIPVGTSSSWVSGSRDADPPTSNRDLTQYLRSCHIPEASCSLGVPVLLSYGVRASGQHRRNPAWCQRPAAVTGAYGTRYTDPSVLSACKNLEVRVSSLRSSASKRAAQAMWGPMPKCFQNGASILASESALRSKEGSPLGLYLCAGQRPKLAGLC